MIYLSEDNIKQLGATWADNVNIIEESVRCISENDYAQPIKPYLRYRNLKNRIIAMPAFVGGKINMSGIKWIASFPENINQGIARAHSVVVLNDADTGVPAGIVNSGGISAIRTASVSGVLIRRFIHARQNTGLRVGIVGFGPIGQHHLSMCMELLGDQCMGVSIYDIKGVKSEFVSDAFKSKVKIVNSWQEAYQDADIFITCTVSKNRYIDQRPKPGSLHLNVSLRDYKADVFPWFKDAMIVDNWEEVCRENTDIEMFHLEKNLQKGDVWSIEDVIRGSCFGQLDDNLAVMFNPMGMAVFDIAISKHYLGKAMEQNIGMHLN